jgi:hypothetical protein
MAVLIAVAAALLAAIAFAALRRPVLARLALRGATRRRGETTLVILGSLLGTAIITGSLLVGDTLDASVRASAPNQLGPTDLVVRSATPQAGEAAAAALDGLSDPSIDGVLALRTLQAAVATTDEGDRRAQPAAQLLEVDFAAAAAFGGDPAATGISGATPKAGETAVGADLAAELGVEVGDAVEAFAYGTSEELTVTAILPRTGVAGYWTGFEATSMNGRRTWSWSRRPATCSRARTRPRRRRPRSRRPWPASKGSRSARSSPTSSPRPTRRVPRSASCSCPSGRSPCSPASCCSSTSS